MSDQKYLLSADEIETMEGLRKTHFLNPRARRVNKSLGDHTGLENIGFHIIEVAPGDLTTEYHVHHYEEECVYVLAGLAAARIGDEHHAIGPGEFIGYRAGGLAHSIENTCTEVLRLIVAGQRLPHDVADYPDKARRIYRNAGLPWQLVDHDAIEDGAGGRKEVRSLTSTAHLARAFPRAHVSRVALMISTCSHGKTCRSMNERTANGS